MQSDDQVPLVTKAASRSRRMLLGMYLVALLIASVVAVAVFVPSLLFPRAKLAELPILTPDPIIGIHAHESLFNDEFIASSYVKWVESAGGRAVRIPYNATTDELAVLLKQVNGLLFPGGYGDPPPQAAFMYKMVLEMNANGTYFPLWGTCLGFEWLVQLQSNNLHILDHVDARNLSSTLRFLPTNAHQNRLLSFSPLYSVLESRPLSYNYHQWAILLDHFQATESLTSFFRPLATSEDRKGQTYVAAIEAINFPIYGVQFHPEKSAYEHTKNANGRAHYAIDHSYEAIVTSQAFAHFFIHEAKKNGHRFASPADEKHAILHNDNASNRSYPSYEEILIFKDPPHN